jgi:SAM-dependent methyltransferase
MSACKRWPGEFRKMPDERRYDTGFFSGLNLSSKNSAQVVVPLILEMLHPQRIVDVGCGTGAWLNVFKEQGCSQVKGYDGDYVDRELRVIAPEEFVVVDLTKPLKDENAPYDLAISLEVAEHIAPESADIFVESLVGLAPVIVFSAAVPGQGGTLHVNEQWPSYWTQKFLRHGYVVIDCLRPQLWEIDEVESYYIQNILVFARPESLALHPALQEAQTKTCAPLNVVHPRLFAYHMEIRDKVTDLENLPIAEATRNYFRSVKGFLSRRMGRATRKS